ncbi:hypothetical protein GCM10022267_55630 [Lentzea roselyniae]|uniref:Uncharacterized protein n=1 Tax=Lentzea roselyniae TaxID=531940 RepID=A0ABP7BKW2_9PSEU
MEVEERAQRLAFARLQRRADSFCGHPASLASRSSYVAGAIGCHWAVRVVLPTVGTVRGQEV